MTNKVKEIKYFCAKCYPDYTQDISICPFCKNRLIKKEIYWDLEAHGYFIKISSLIALKNMRKGAIWFRPPVYFNRYEQDDVIGDSQEFLVQVDPDDKKFDPNINKKLIFCMYFLTTDKNGNYSIPEQDKDNLQKFGNSVSFISFAKFKKLIEKYVIREANKIVGNHVSYYTDKMCGAINPFFKRIKYNYQNEYRFILEDERFLSLYNEDGSLKEDKFVYKHRRNLKKVFSKPIDLEIILNSQNEKDWDHLIKMY